MTDLTTLFAHAKPGTPFGPLDAAELIRVQDNPEELKSMADELLAKDVPGAVRDILMEVTGSTAEYSSQQRQRDFVRNRLGTEGMDMSDYDTPEIRDEDEDGSMVLDFGDEEDDNTPEPSPMQPLATALFDALTRAAMRSGQQSVLPEIVAAAQKVEETKTIAPLYPIFSKKDRELAMMAPHMANDDDLEKALNEMAETIPFAATCHRVILEARQGIADGIKPAAVLASAFFYLLAEKG